MTMVTSTGFEPVNAALRGLRLKPLVDGAIAELVYSIQRKISILIDSGIISWDSAIEPISLNDINKDIKDFKHLIYESWEKLYVYKHIINSELYVTVQPFAE